MTRAARISRRVLPAGIGACLLLAAGATIAQVSGHSVSGRTRVSGKVTDPQGKGLPEVLIRMVNPEISTKTAQTKTKKDGSFVHPLVEFGKYKISAEKPGYKVISYKIENRASDGTDVGSYGPVKFEEAQDPRKMDLKPSGSAVLEIVMAPEQDYTRLALEAADQGGAAASGGAVRKRHPAEEGKELYQAKDYQGALTKFQEALELPDGKDDPNLHFALARTQYDLEQYDAAMASLESVVALDKEPRPGLRYLQALIANKQGKTAEAIHFLEEERKAAAKPDPAVLTTLGSLYRDLGRKDEAIATLDEAVAVDPMNIKALMMLGSLYNAKGDQAMSESYFQKAASAGASMGKEGAVVFFNLGAINYNQKDYRTAADAYERALAIRPDYAAAHRELGYTYKELRQLQKAREHLEKYLQLSPDAKDKAEVTALVSVLAQAR